LKNRREAGWDIPAPAASVAGLANQNEGHRMDTNQIGSSVRNMEERVEEQVKDVSRRMQTAAEKIVDLAKENPALSLAAAFGLGYLIARLARRS
jgi:hypothetical protein